MLQRGTMCLQPECCYGKRNISPSHHMPATAYDRPTSLLEIEGITVRYGGAVAVRDASMHFGPGITGLIGPNGAGKTSLIDAVAGSIAPAAGRVVLDGRDITRVKA